MLKISYLLGLGLGGLLMAMFVWKSVTDYRPKYNIQVELPPGEPLTERVLLLVLDGIRSDVVEEMAFLTELAERGSSGVVRTVLPSLSNPARAAMATGAWPEVNGVTNNGKYSPPPVDSIFSLAERMQVPRAVAGSRFWRRAFGDYLEGAVFSRSKRPSGRVARRDPAAWQQELCSEQVDFLRQQDRGLLAAGIFVADGAGHDYGGESEEYRASARVVDRCVKLMVEALDDGRTTFVITSDHGHVHRRGRGGHGGTEPEVTEAPMVLYGRAITKSQDWRAEQVDVAPTICALLGLPLPATSQGRILWGSLAVPDAIATHLKKREAEQRRLAQEKLPDPVQGRIAERRERRLQALGSLVLFSMVLGWTGLRRPRNWRWLAAGVAVYYGAYYFFFWLFGLGYSLSAVGREEYLMSFFGRDIGAAAIAVLVCFGLFRWQAPASNEFLFLDLGIAVSATLAIQITVIYFWHGLFMNGFTPDLNAGFKACLDLLQIFAVGLSVPLILLSRQAFPWWSAHASAPRV